MKNFPRGRIFTFSSLPEKGISYSRNHIRRLVAKGKFPAPFYLSERVPAWSEATIDEWIEQLEHASGDRRMKREHARVEPVAETPKRS